ncbi:RraA family protein [Dactylosporangium salmoneum]|uniref:Putative 4-hydroxy-4-methyl-2-oxoglutarate aldolase n=1 Tax=Dactylosporangium salmoneum TaxID=53361 RepID=A0ABP5ST24_9ACTN
MEVDTSAVCDVAKDTRVMSPELRCRSRNPAILGPAFTVRCREDFFAVARAIEAAAPGDVVVVDGGGRPTALAGELFARAAENRGLAGLIVDGGYRDLGYVATCELPVYSRHVTPMAGTTARPGALNEPVTCGGVTVRPGDLILADLDGIVVLDPAAAPAVLAAAAELKATEARALARLAEGGSLGDCLNVAEHAADLAAGRPSALRFTV